MGRLYDDDRLAGVYDPGNRMPQRSPQAWTALIGSFTRQPGPLILDLGTPLIRGDWPVSGPDCFRGTPVEWYPGWVTLEPPPRGQRLSFQGTGADQVAAPGAGRIVHSEVLVSDLAAAHERVVAAGGTFVGEHTSPRPGPGGQEVPWRVYRDRAGHPFCLVIR